MTPRSRFGTATALALAGVLAVAACESDRATVFCTPGDEGCDIVGPPAFNFALIPNGTALAGVPSGTATVGASAVTVRASKLKALATGQYQFWVIGRDAQNLDVPAAAFGTVVEFYLRADLDANGDTIRDPITGDPILVTDSTIVSATRTSAYAGTDDQAVTQVRVIIDSTADGSNPSANNAVFLTIEGSAASTPSAARFLWRRTGVGGSGSLSFGTFSGSDVINVVSPNDYVFQTGGTGEGGFKGDELSVDLFELTRPPAGYFYRGYLVDADDDELMIDTLRAAWSRDNTVSRASLYDADWDDLLPGVVATGITRSNVRNCRQGSGLLNCGNSLDVAQDNPFASYLLFELHLEPKGGSAVRSPTVTHVGEVPDKVRTP